MNTEQKKVTDSLVASESKAQYLALKCYDDKRKMIDRAMTGHYQGWYWAQRSADNIFEVTGIRLSLRADAWNPTNVTLEW